MNHLNCSSEREFNSTDSYPQNKNGKATPDSRLRASPWTEKTQKFGITLLRITKQPRHPPKGTPIDRVREVIESKVYHFFTNAPQPIIDLALLLSDYPTRLCTNEGSEVRK